MTAALTPQTALAWLRSLSADVEAAAVLDAHAGVLAGDRALGPRVAAADATLVVARSATRMVAVRPGPAAPMRLLEADVRGALEALEPR
ncbi:MAG TPA: hypothetical protein VN751_03700 [Solirubrobacteraceae bacterium]|jgi:hypothetical protein|nr:hypothetical protein [Solirubrobacteraceae bacterium]